MVPASRSSANTPPTAPVGRGKPAKMPAGSSTCAIVPEKPIEVGSAFVGAGARARRAAPKVTVRPETTRIVGSSIFTGRCRRATQYQSKIRHEQGRPLDRDPFGAHIEHGRGGHRRGGRGPRHHARTLLLDRGGDAG